MITLEIVTIRNRLTIITLSEFKTSVFSYFHTKIYLILSLRMAFRWSLWSLNSKDDPKTIKRSKSKTIRSKSKPSFEQNWEKLLIWNEGGVNGDLRVVQQYHYQHRPMRIPVENFIDWDVMSIEVKRYRLFKLKSLIGTWKKSFFIGNLNMNKATQNWNESGRSFHILK